MKKYTQKELNLILEKHQHWLRRDCDGWETMKADLSNTDLSDAYLRWADLRHIDLTGSNLEFADLKCAHLEYARLNNANFRGASLEGADLRYAHLEYAVLSCAILVDANLTGANLYGADLSGVHLDGAILKDASLACAKNIPFIPYACPDTGSFIGYKKVDVRIVKLEIPSDARRCSATGRKCRCDKAKVLSVQFLDEDMPCDDEEVASDFDSSFIYRVGEIIEEPEFDENRWKECAKGIHFFINRQEAVEY